MTGIILISTALKERWDGPASVIDDVLRNGSYAGTINGIEEAAEDLRSLPDRSVDVVLSNAVLEHVSDLHSVVRELYRVTSAGGIHSHQVDFRDHHDFERPLEFLTVPDDEFSTEFEQASGRFGNRWRPSELGDIFIDAGFTIEAYGVSAYAEPNYLSDVVPRLRASSSKYCDWPEEELVELGARFVLTVAKDERF